MRVARPLPRYLSGDVTRIIGKRVPVVQPVRERHFHEPGMQDCNPILHARLHTWIVPSRSEIQKLV